ncbi:hypothetical protein ACLMJK_006521 [Lecanora helva]
MASLEGEITALSNEIQHVPATKKLLARPALNFMLDLIGVPLPASPIQQLRQFLAKVNASEDHLKITACEANLTQIIDLFDLKMNFLSKRTTWLLIEENQLQAPKILKRSLRDLGLSFYEDHNEATCRIRIAIDIILLRCRVYLRENNNNLDKEPILHSSSTSPSTSPESVTHGSKSTLPKPLRLYPESCISVEIPNPTGTSGKVLVTGRADWAFGHTPINEDGALLVAMGAKQRTEFSAVEARLITYLAILREKRRQAGKVNLLTQGFYSDGVRFAFISIREDGTVILSPTCDIFMRDGLDLVFSYIVAMLETAMKSPPSTSPTNPGSARENKIEKFDSEKWAKIYKLMDDSLAINDNSDDDMENMIGI